MGLEELGISENCYEAFADYYGSSDLDRSPEIAFYQEKARGRRSILDLGCGPGTFTIPLAIQAWQANGPTARIVGLDLSGRMLSIARRKEPRIEWINGDVRTPPVDGPFDFILASLNILQALLTSEDLSQALNAVRVRLAPSGIFAFDIYQPNLAFLNLPFEELPVRSFAASDGRRLEIIEKRVYDPESRILTGDWRVVAAGDHAGKTLAAQRTMLRQYSAEEIEHALDKARLVIRERYGDFDGSEFTGEHPRSRSSSVMARALPKEFVTPRWRRPGAIKRHARRDSA